MVRLFNPRFVCWMSVTMVLTALAVLTAYKVRGYFFTVGGEWAIPGYALVINRVVGIKKRRQKY